MSDNSRLSSVELSDGVSEHDQSVRDAMWLELRAEQVAVTKRQRVAEIVRVSTQTRTKDVVVDEPLLSETVVVERVPVGRYVDTVPDVRQEGDVMVMPVVDEEIVVTKRLFLREEVRLRRSRMETRHVETVSLREQVANVTRVAADPIAPPQLATARDQSVLANKPLGEPR